ncbi:MAG TPA: carboxypeptidase-like regulatory domain-containing protein [Acidimicrobiales bacterium]
MRRAFVVFVVVAAFVAAAACTNKGVPPLPAPPTTRVAPSTTALVDLTGVMLREVPGRTTTTVALTPGKATVNGSVVATDGLVPGAVVRAERLVGDSLASIDVATAADGTFALPAVKGGRWRVRAFRAPDLALIKPEVFFLGESETKTLTLRVERYTGVGVSSALAPDPPVVGDPANLVVQVTLQSVDANGVVRGVPVPGARVELVGSGDWRVDGTNAQATDGSGRVLWRVRCESPGNQPLSAFVGDDGTFPLTLPACVAAPPSTTTSSIVDTTSSSTPGSSSTSSSTSTTAPRNRNPND